MSQGEMQIAIHKVLSGCGVTLIIEKVVIARVKFIISWWSLRL